MRNSKMKVKKLENPGDALLLKPRKDIVEIINTELFGEICVFPAVLDIKEDGRIYFVAKVKGGNVYGLRFDKNKLKTSSGRLNGDVEGCRVVKYGPEMPEYSEKRKILEEAGVW